MIIPQQQQMNVDIKAFVFQTNVIDVYYYQWCLSRRSFSCCIKVIIRLHQYLCVFSSQQKNGEYWLAFARTIGFKVAPKIVHDVYILPPVILT
jgi:hypothetical protein